MSVNFKQAIAIWKGDLRFDAASLETGAVVQMDGSGQTGFSPMELVLVGLAGCTGADVADILRKKRQQVTAIEVQVRGNRAEAHPMRYTDIQVKYVVTGHALDPEAVRRAIELSETRYCSVSASLKPTVNVSTRFEIHQAQPEPESAVLS